jgi:hypothetical protein
MVLTGVRAGSEATKGGEPECVRTFVPGSRNSGIQAPPHGRRVRDCFARLVLPVEDPRSDQFCTAEMGGPLISCEVEHFQFSKKCAGVREPWLAQRGGGFTLAACQTPSQESASLQAPNPPFGCQSDCVPWSSPLSHGNSKLLSLRPGPVAIVRPEPCRRPNWFSLEREIQLGNRMAT